MEPVQHSIIITVPPAEVKDALLSHDHLSKWWGVERSYIEPHVDGIYSLVWGISENGFSYVSSGVITEISNDTLTIDKMVYFNFEKPILGGMKVEYKFDPHEGGTHLFIRQTGYKEGSDWAWYHKAVQAGWPEALKILKKYLETKV